MTTPRPTPARPRPRLRRWVLLLVVGLAAVLTVPALVRAATGPGPGLPWGPECTVDTAEGQVGISTDQAQRATTAVVLRERGLAGPATDDIAGSVLVRLAEGPPQDAGPSLSCRVAPEDDLAPETLTESGLTPRAEAVRREMGAVFGDQSLGGYESGGVDAGHGSESTHYDGRAIDVFYRPVGEENRRQGWLLAHWLVAHAADLRVQYVIFDDRYWGVEGSARGWRDYAAPDPGNDVLRHLDHVHVDVLRGGT